MLSIVTKVGPLQKLSSDLVKQLTRRNVRRFAYLSCFKGYVGTFAVKRLYKRNQISCSSGVLNLCTAVDRQNLPTEELTVVQFEKISDETLESLTEYFDELIEQATHLKDADVSYGDGVLTVILGNPYGTYVINRQTPNKQIWLSSPKSGPKRYDFIDGKWIYKHDGKSLHELLNSEISAIVQKEVCFDKCFYSGKGQ